MSLLYMDGFDAQDFTLRGWAPIASSGTPVATLTSVTPFGSGYAVTITGPNSTNANGGFVRSIPATAQIYAGAYIQDNSVNGTWGNHLFGLSSDGGVTSHIYLEHSNSGSLLLYRGSTLTGSGGGAPNGTLLASSVAGALPLSSFHRVEMSAKIDSTTGTVEVRVDGQTVLNFTGNTRNGGTSTNIDTISFVCSEGFYSSSNAITIDDLYVCDNQGTVNNTFLGDVQVQTIFPIAAGSTTQFTPTGSASNYVNVNDVPDSSSTYNSSSTAGQRDTYAMGDLAAGTGTIYGVQQVMHSFKTSYGNATLKAAQKSGVTVSYGTAHSLSPSNAAYLDLFETNPATSAPYTASDVDGLEAGAEVV